MIKIEKKIHIKRMRSLLNSFPVTKFWEISFRKVNLKSSCSIKWAKRYIKNGQ